MAGARGSSRSRRAHQVRESRERQWIYIGTAVVLGVTAVIIAVGVLLTQYLPPRAHVLTVGTATYNARDVAERAAYLARSGNNAAFQNPPDVTVESLINQELLLQSGPAVVGEVDDAAVREAIATRLGLTGDFTDQEYGEALANHLRTIDLGRADLDVIIRAGLIEGRLTERFKSDLPESGDQFHVFQVRTNDRAKAQALVDAVRAGGDFQAAALEAGVATTAAEVQDLGWVAPEAVDERVRDTLQPLQSGDVSDLVSDVNNVGFEVFYVEERTTDQPYDEAVRDQLADLALVDYLDEQRAAFAPQIDLSADERRWITREAQEALMSGG